MKALTVCQPYASLIVGWPGINAEDVKRVENRGRYFSYRGPLLIHVGKSRSYLNTPDGQYYGEAVPKPMPMGVIVGSVDVTECWRIDVIRAMAASHRLAWLKSHAHTEGRWCLVLRHPRRLLLPIPFRGQQGIFDVPEILLSGAEWEPQCRVCRCTELDACEGGCRWVDKDVCSACADKVFAAAREITLESLTAEAQRRGR